MTLTFCYEQELTEGDEDDFEGSYYINLEIVHDHVRFLYDINFIIQMTDSYKASTR